MNLINTAIRESIHSADRSADRVALGRLAIASFAILLFFNLAGPISVSLWRLCALYKLRVYKTSDRVRHWFEFLVVSSQTVLITSFYFIGDNLYPTVREYGNFTVGKCDNQCQQDSRAASLAFLSIASFMLLFLKYIFSVIIDMCGYKEKKSVEYEVLGVFVQVVKIDIVYTTVIGIGTAFGYVNIESEDGNFCDEESKSFGKAIAVITLTVIGIPILALACIKVCYIAKASILSIILCIGLFFISYITLVLYVLADNHLPLEFDLCGLDHESQIYLEKRRQISINRCIMGWTDLALIFFVFLIKIGSAFSVVVDLVICNADALDGD